LLKLSKTVSQPLRVWLLMRDFCLSISSVTSGFAFLPTGWAGPNVGEANAVKKPLWKSTDWEKAAADLAVAELMWIKGRSCWHTLKPGKSWELSCARDWYWPKNCCELLEGAIRW